MLDLRHAVDAAYRAHLETARRVLALPVRESGLKWHPFGVYAIPLARRVDEAGRTWSRRLHVWHPDAAPVGETSPYGVHTHSGTATSHVLAGTLHHHLYMFRRAEDGAWREVSRGGEHGAALVAHVQGETRSGMTHTLPANQPHGVSKPPVFAISLFEQVEEGRGQPFTAWQCLEGDPEVLLAAGPVEARRVQREALAIIEAALYAAQ